MTRSMAPISRAAASGFAPASARYEVLGTCLAVDTDVPAAAAAIADSYGAFAVHAPERDASPLGLALHRIRGRYRLRDHHGDVTLVTREQDAVVALFDLVVAAILEGLGERRMLGVHAGAVAIGGRAVILAGPSGRGKSTLTLGILRHGGALLSDEMAVIVDDGTTVLPFPRSIHVRPATLRMFPELEFIDRRPRYDLGGGSEWCVRAEDLAAAFGAGIAPATPIAGIVLLDGAPAAMRAPRFEPVTPALAAMELMRGTPAAARDFGATMGLLARVAEGARCARLQMGDLDAASRIVVDWMAESE